MHKHLKNTAKNRTKLSLRFFSSLNQFLHSALNEYNENNLIDYLIVNCFLLLLLFHAACCRVWEWLDSSSGLGKHKKWQQHGGSFAGRIPYPPEPCAGAT